ncbi:MAG: hypothetical protein ACOCU8_02735 [Patescibacteria group bacterium]
MKNQNYIYYIILGILIIVAGIVLGIINNSKKEPEIITPPETTNNNDIETDNNGQEIVELNKDEKEEMVQQIKEQIKKDFNLENNIEEENNQDDFILEETFISFPYAVQIWTTEHTGGFVVLKFSETNNEWTSLDSDGGAPYTQYLMDFYNIPQKNAEDLVNKIYNL